LVFDFDSLPPLKGLPFIGSHFRGKLFMADLLYPGDAGCPVGIENHSKEPGHEIMVLLACIKLNEVTIRTTQEFVLDAALTHLAPGHPGVFPAARTFFFQVRTAGPAIESAICDEIFVGDDFFHIFFFG
jgi:hypothetical protein